MTDSIPNSKNFCGGAFPDWMEVNLIKECNAKCAWCIEKKGFHPTEVAPWEAIVEEILKSGALNIILLGGEPTLFKHLKEVIDSLTEKGKRVWITTNGSLLTKKFAKDKLQNLYGMNISIHHYDMAENKKITGLLLKEENLKAAIKELHKHNAFVRFNCNCLNTGIDSVEKIENYIMFVKEIGGDKIRFAELKDDTDSFVDLAKLLNYKYGLNDNPFTLGCNSDAVINGMPVNFRQMCGLQTSLRECPINPKQVSKKVVYYDGKTYNGWQTLPESEQDMLKKELLAILEKVQNGELSAEDAALLIKRDEDARLTKLEKAVETLKRTQYEGTGGCAY